MALIIGLESRVIGRADRVSSFSLETCNPPSALGDSRVKLNLKIRSIYQKPAAGKITIQPNFLQEMSASFYGKVNRFLRRYTEEVDCLFVESHRMFLRCKLLR